MLLCLPPYSPHLNLIERLWKFVKKQGLYAMYYPDFAPTFDLAKEPCWSHFLQFKDLAIPSRCWCDFTVRRNGAAGL
jgi:transposase